MTQFSRPVGTPVSVGWTGSAADVADSGGVNDATYIESPLSPTGASYWDAALSAVTEPNVDAGFVLRFRVVASALGGDVKQVTVRLYRSADDVIILQTTAPVTYPAGEVNLELSPADAALITSFGSGAVRVRVWAEPITSGTKSLVTINDLAWQGMYRIPDEGDIGATGGGSTYVRGGVGLRYVGSERRFLQCWYRTASPHLGSLAEYRIPAASSYYQGSGAQGDWYNATALERVTLWTNWHLAPAGDIGCGALYWDDTYHGVWYTLPYEYYAGPLTSIGFTQLNDDGTCVKYGPWYYGSSTGAEWKAILGSFIEIPAAYRVGALEGYSVMMAPAYTSQSSPHWQFGPGMIAVQLPNPTTFPALGVIPAGVPIADYRPASGFMWPHYCCERLTDYQSLRFAYGSTTPPVTEGVGRWQMFTDALQGACWVDAPTRHGILHIGHRVVGDSWYGYNPQWFSSVDGTEKTAEFDPDNVIGGPLGADVRGYSPWSRDSAYYDVGGTPIHGYVAEGFQSALWTFHPDHVREVAMGTRVATPTGMKPVATDQWDVAFPKVALTGVSAERNNPPHYNPTAGYESVHNATTQLNPFSNPWQNAGLLWDSRANQMIWMHGNLGGDLLTWSGPWNSTVVDVWTVS